MWQSHKIKWDCSTGKLKVICGSPHVESGDDVHPKEKNMVQRVEIWDQKFRLGSKSLKLNEIIRNFKSSLSEKIPIKQINDTSICHTRCWRILVQESPNSSLRQLLEAISKILNKITILSCKQKYRSNYCTKINLQKIYWDNSTTRLP